MCRHLAAVGDAVPVAELLLDARNALVRQAWAPRRQSHGVVAADGFGLGWYPREQGPRAPDGGALPLLHRGCDPVWSDETFAQTARHVQAGAVLASVRSATAGTARGVGAAMPFRHGRHLFAHNGALDGWPDAAAPLAATVGTRRLLRMEAMTDAALLWALVLDRLDLGADLVDAVAGVVDTARTMCGGRLNLLATDGVRIVATAAGASLSYRVRATDDAAAATDRRPGHVVVASEPVDDAPGWVDVPDDSLVVATTSGVRVEAL